MGYSLVDIITVESVDGTSHDISVTINGVGSAPEHDASTLSAATNQEEAVNTITTSNDQTEASVAVFPGGGYIVAWISKDSSGRDVVMAKRYDASGDPEGSEFQVSGSATSGSERYQSPSVAVLDNGSFAVSWTRFDFKSSSPATGQGRFFTANGTALPQHDFSISGDYVSEINALDSNRYAVSVVDGSGSQHKVRTRIYDGLGDSEVNFVTDVTNHQWAAPDITALGNGLFAMTWRDERTTSNSAKLEIFQTAGLFSVSRHGPVSFGGPAATVQDDSHNLTKVIQLSDGTLATSYKSGGTWYIQRWNDNATQLGNAFAVSDSGVVADTNVQLTALSDGFVATFGAPDANGEGVYARRFNNNGSAASDAVLINATTTGDQVAPTVVELADGSIKAVWGSDHSGDSDIYQTTLTFDQQVGVDENAQPGTVVGRVSATDPDGDALTFSLIDDAGGRFAIDPNTGIVSVASVLDFESASSHQLEVRVTDANGEFSDQSYVVSVKDNQETYETPSGLSLKGSTDSYAVINKVADHTFPLDGLTVEMWLKPGTNYAETPITYAVGSSDEMQVYLRPSLDKAFIYIGGSVHSVDMPGLFDGEWHHFAFSWDNSSGAIRTYLDGDLENTGTIGVWYSLKSGGGLVLGQEADNQMGGYDSSQAYSGEMRDVRVWTTWRSQSEIQTEMHNPDVSSFYLYNHYKLDGDTQDSGSKPNHLTLVNGEWITRGTDAAESIHDYNSSTGDDILIGGAGADAFIWQVDDLGTAGSPAEDTVRDFQSGVGGDVLDLSDVLTGEENNALDQYLSFNFASGDTTIEIRSQAGGDVLQKVKLEGVDLSGLGNTDADIINKLVSDGNLRLDE